MWLPGSNNTRALLILKRSLADVPFSSAISFVFSGGERCVNAQIAVIDESIKL